MDDPAKRDSAGRFGPGNQANPSGRPKKIREFHKWLSEQAYPKAQAALLACLDDEDGRVRVAALREVFDRMFGKPKQPITGDDGKPLVDIAPLLERLAKP